MYTLASSLIIIVGLVLSLVFPDKKKLIWIVTVCAAVLSLFPYLLGFFVTLLADFVL